MLDRFDALRERLLRAGIAPRRVRRYLAELQDHLIELTRCEKDAGYDAGTAALRARAALGDDAMLAEALLAQPRLRSFTARAPWLIFGLLPPLAMFLTTLVLMLMLIFAVTMGSHDMLPRYQHGILVKHAVVAPEWFSAIAGVFTATGNLLTAPLIAALFVVLARRQRMALIWPALCTAMLLLLFLHFDAMRPLPIPLNRGMSVMVSMRYLYSGGSLGVRLAPVFSPAAWQMMAGQWPLVAAQYLLTLLPLAWLLRVRQRPART